MFKNILVKLLLGLGSFAVGAILKQAGAPTWGAILGGLTVFGFELTFWALSNLTDLMIEFQTERDADSGLTE